MSKYTSGKTTQKRDKCIQRKSSEISALKAEIDRLNKACDQRAAHEYKLMGEIDALKQQNAELLAAQEGTPCKHKFNAVFGGVLSCIHCYESFSEQQQAIAKATGGKS